MKNFLLAFILGTLPFLATGKPIPAITDSLGNRIYNLNAITIISNPKWDSKLFEFPGSISYLNTGNLDEMNIRSVKDISTVVPNLFIPDYGSKLISSAYIRGIGSRINSPAVGLYVNNVPYLDKSAFDFDFIDIASIEVLKGPQGTLYGRNTMAGLVNIKTLSPLEKQGSKIKLSFGNYNLWGVAATTSQKLTDDFAFSINARYRQDDGYFKNEYTRQNSGSTRSGGGRVQLDWRVNRHWKLSFSGDYEGSDQQGYPYAGYDKTLKKTGSISYNDEASYRRDIFTSGLSAQYLHDRFIFTSTTGYQFLDDDMHLDQDFTPRAIFTLQQKQKMHAVSQEFAIKSHKGKRWEWVGGLFGFYQQTHTDGPVDFKQDGIDLLITKQTNDQLAALKQDPALAGMPDITIDIDNRNLYIDGIYKTPTYGAAAFGQATLNRIFIDGLSATVGLRIDYEHTRIYHHTHATEALTGRANVTINMGNRPPMSIQQPFILPLGIDGKESMKNRPMKGFIQVLQVLLFFVGGIVIIAIIVNKSPASLFAGLGASAAILMLVFKDSILGFVAGIQLSANDMVRPGDWITLPSGAANGTVQEITLNTVKIQNFDNTISTVPPYTLVSSPFQNWRGMVQSGGRRVMKNITLDLTTLQFCTPEMLDRYRKEIPLMADYQPEAGVVPTNSQVYRVYIERYLCSLPVVNQDLDLIISQKEATMYGVPIQVYFFSRNKVWKEYERIQSDIFDHLLAMVPKFDLKVYQYSD